MNRRGFFKMIGIAPVAGTMIPMKIKPKKRKEVYFSDKGNDINGDGSYEKPYKTMGQAYKENPKIVTYIMNMDTWGIHTLTGPLKVWKSIHNSRVI